MPKYRGYLTMNPKKRTKEIEAATDSEALKQAAEMLKAECDSVMLVRATFLTCPKCAYRWKFSGRRKMFATCPQCLKQVSIKEASR